MSGGHGPLLAIGPAGDPESPVHRLDPRAKLVTLVGVTLVAVSAPAAAWPAYVACAAVLAMVAARSGVGWSTIWRRSRAVLPLVLLAGASLPFLDRGGATWELGPLAVSEAGLAVFAAAAAKATLGTVSAVLLGATTSFPAVLRALEALRVPRLLVLITGFAYRYLFVLADEARRMRVALAARGHAPRHVLDAGAVGRIATALFLRAHARGERVHVAMLARGWAGRMPYAAPLSLTRSDALFCALVAGPPLAVRLLLEVAR
jgi:cobalt/nickel transport system permease protein